MGILDDAIREHIDLKRKHGARDSEISEIEDEALGSGERPDPFAAGELFGGVSSAGSSAPEAPEQEMVPTTPPPDGPPTPPPDGLAEPAAPEEPTALVEPPAARAALRFGATGRVRVARGPDGGGGRVRSPGALRLGGAATSAP